MNSPSPPGGGGGGGGLSVMMTVFGVADSTTAATIFLGSGETPNLEKKSWSKMDAMPLGDTQNS